MRTNSLKRTLTAGGAAFGPNLQIPSPWLVEIIAGAGFDYVMLDGEHGAAFDDLANLIIAADGAGITPVVRVPNHDRSWLLRALEYGAGGVQVPMVNTPQEARRIVDEVKYAPLGNRGFSSVTRSARYGAADARDHATSANGETMLVLQLESKQAVQNAAAISKVSGVDMLFIGPGDLAQSLGHPGEPTAPAVVKAMREIIAAVADRVILSTSAFAADDVRVWHQAGVRCFLTSSMHPIRRTFEATRAELVAGCPHDGA